MVVRLKFVAKAHELIHELATSIHQFFDVRFRLRQDLFVGLLLFDAVLERRLRPVDRFLDESRAGIPLRDRLSRI